MRLDSLIAAARDHLGADLIIAEHGATEERFASAKDAVKCAAECADVCRYRFARDGEVVPGWILWLPHESGADRLADYSVNLQPVVDRLDNGADT